MNGNSINFTVCPTPKEGFWLLIQYLDLALEFMFNFRLT